MRLLCDLGNTRIKWAWAEGVTLSGFGSGDYSGAEAYAAVLAGTIRPEAIAAISVAHHRDETFARFCEERWSMSPHWYRSLREGFGIVSLYEPPASLGADRFAALVGARARFPGRPLRVVDCGTAITIDAIDGQGVFQGGAILPGLAAAAGALRGIAPYLAPGAQDRPYLACGRTTQEAVGAGLLLGAAGAIERILRDQGGAPEGAVLVLLTGGDAARLAPYLTRSYGQFPHLTLEGLAVMAP
ncbi:type III pantothenate kinase [Acidiferrobacter sp.]|uniref:type III pantothenate kinase n=1 Tax=Acidiferrobacter sp. TaxID=1872107 RepID=UPI0026203AA7|nr:type III pantothenate kinase [Acidiferrobacter sp.]